MRGDEGNLRKVMWEARFICGEGKFYCGIVRYIAGSAFHVRC